MFRPPSFYGPNLFQTCIRHASGTRGSPALRAPPKPKSAGTSADAHLYKTFKPITPGIRHLKLVRNEHLWPGKPIRELTVPRRKSGGRNNSGRITVRHIGGGHRQRIRIIDYRRQAPGVHDVVRIEYDPGRSAHIALVKSRDESLEPHKRWSYILASDGMRAGHTVESYQKGIPNGLVPGFKDAPGARPGVDETVGGGGNASALALAILRATTIRVGNVLPLRLIPTGTTIHNIGLHPGKGGQLVRAAGTYGQVIDHDKDGKHTHVRLQSGEVRLINQEACATVGKVSNPLWENQNLGKAGRNRWLGRRPHVRGVAMNKFVRLFS